MSKCNVGYSLMFIYGFWLPLWYLLVFHLRFWLPLWYLLAFYLRLLVTLLVSSSFSFTTSGYPFGVFSFSYYHNLYQLTLYRSKHIYSKLIVVLSLSVAWKVNYYCSTVHEFLITNKKQAFNCHWFHTNTIIMII